MTPYHTSWRHALPSSSTPPADPPSSAGRMLGSNFCRSLRSSDIVCTRRLRKPQVVNRHIRQSHGILNFSIILNTFAHFEVIGHSNINYKLYGNRNNEVKKCETPTTTNYPNIQMFRTHYKSPERPRPRLRFMVWESGGCTVVFTCGEAGRTMFC